MHNARNEAIEEFPTGKQQVIARGLTVTMQLKGASLDRRDAMAAETGQLQPPEALSLNGEGAGCPPPCFLLCGHRVSAVPLHAPRLNRYGLALARRRRVNMPLPGYASKTLATVGVASL